MKEPRNRGGQGSDSSSSTDFELSVRASPARANKTRTGVVVSDKMEKTVVVRVARLVLEGRFKKYVKRRKKFLAHDEKEECSIGDWVEIQETRPLSKRKSWRVTAILKKGAGQEIEIKE